jgi:hypothetical protein
MLLRIVFKLCGTCLCMHVNGWSLFPSGSWALLLLWVCALCHLFEPNYGVTLQERHLVLEKPILHQSYT